METELRHTLVQYQGGGYDGCFWEWNFFYIDADGEFHDITSSGRAGCDTAEKADAMLAENHDHTHTYDVTNPADIAEFSRESNAVHIKGVLQWMNGNDVPFYTACTECSNTVEWAEDLALEDWHGCGGLASTADKLLCTDCHSAGMCDCCNEYVGVDDITPMDGRHNTNGQHLIGAEISMIKDGYTYVCDWCLTDRANQIEHDGQVDMLSASLATGTPDLFSDEMNWFWR